MECDDVRMMYVQPVTCLRRGGEVGGVAGVACSSGGRYSSRGIYPLLRRL